MCISYFSPIPHCVRKRTYSFPGITLTILNVILQFLAHIIPKVRFTKTRKICFWNLHIAMLAQLWRQKSRVRFWSTFGNVSISVDLMIWRIHFAKLQCFGLAYVMHTCHCGMIIFLRLPVQLFKLTSFMNFILLSVSCSVWRVTVICEESRDCCRKLMLGILFDFCTLNNVWLYNTNK